MPTETKKRTLTSQSNPKLLDLLEMGAEIRLPDGRYLGGETDTGYINIGRHDVYMGAYSLDRDGLRRALQDRDWNDCVQDQ